MDISIISAVPWHLRGDALGNGKKRDKALKGRDNIVPSVGKIEPPLQGVVRNQSVPQGCARASLALGWLVSGLWPEGHTFGAFSVSNPKCRTRSSSSTKSGKRNIEKVVDCIRREFYKAIPSSPMRAYHTISKHSPTTTWLRRTGMLCSVAGIGFGQPSCANEDLTKEAGRQFTI